MLQLGGKGFEILIDLTHSTLCGGVSSCEEAESHGAREGKKRTEKEEAAFWMLVAACIKSSPNRLSSVVSPNDCSVSARSIMWLPISVKHAC